LTAPSPAPPLDRPHAAACRLGSPPDRQSAISLAAKQDALLKMFPNLNIPKPQAEDEEAQ
jgi:hypothetical protein